MLDPVVERLEEIRKYLKINKSEFARRIDSPQSFVSKIFSGERNPGPGTIDKVVKNLGVDRQWLETGEGEMLSRLTASGTFSPIENALGYSVNGKNIWQESQVAELKKRIEELERDKYFLMEQVHFLQQMIKDRNLPAQENPL